MEFASFNKNLKLQRESNNYSADSLSFWVQK